MSLPTEAAQSALRLGDPSKLLVFVAILSTVTWAFHSTVRDGFRSQRLLTVCVLMAANALFTSAMIISHHAAMDWTTRLLILITLLQPLIIAVAMAPALYLAVEQGNEETEFIKEELYLVKERALHLATQICIFYTIHTTCLAPEDDDFLEC
mmetsp:Transcript_38330/g.93920  ORF Transcript_38330/g.93920 Transcript_38330/m.93920 type:complete len:152 (-) Transcript_38330:350-805(-)